MEENQKNVPLEIETVSIKKVSLTLRAINHPLRKQMLQAIHLQVRMTVTQLFIKLRIEQSVASQHLAILRKAGLVTTERDGKFIFYSVNYPGLKKLHETANKISA